MKIIFDTNIIISSFIFKGRLKNIVQKAANYYDLCFSKELVNEVLDKFIGKFKADEQQKSDFLFIMKNIYS